MAIDLIILTVYTAVEGAKGNLEANRVPHTENPQDIVGVSDFKLARACSYNILRSAFIKVIIIQTVE